MDAYIYQADLWCKECGESIREELRVAGKAPPTPDNEWSFDSDDYPKGPFSHGGGESDTVHHCAAYEDCENAIEIDGAKYGVMLENDLTHAGQEWLAEQIREDPRSAVVQFWYEFYKDWYPGLPNPSDLIDAETVELGTPGE